ncbi:hypothetical protein DEJ50_04765 [Streptomyces venezuelae]|uniref:FHA domain-containing protein n=1 Tax=Streptomyces venezuelae TaxID=54571 RepID=A0A5P2CWL7_STRVZ|nr:FHA domain-containing protein [Streptomyces venezuelae]QES47245.1 hypothetical protein DEJ50_04765 [Streptomyces venezuelae]
MSTPEPDDWDDDFLPTGFVPTLVGQRSDTVPSRREPDRPGGPPAAPAVLRFLEVPLTLTVAPGTLVGLGRDPDWAPRTAVALAHHHTVSARHAGLAVAADGSATVTEELPGATNGTRLNRTDLVAGVSYPVTDGDRLWLGPRVSCTVQLGRGQRETP